MAKTLSENGQKRTRRIGVIVTDETYNAIRALAALSGVSMNDYCNIVLGEEVKKNNSVVTQMLEVQKLYEWTTAQTKSLSARMRKLREEEEKADDTPADIPEVETKLETVEKKNAP